MYTFNFCSFKGGSSKTSTAIHIGACLAKYHNKRVLLIDYDSQANMSFGLGVGCDTLDTMIPVLEGEKKVTSVIKETAIEGLSFIASNPYLEGIEIRHPLVSNRYAHEYLRRSLKDIQDDYDFCFIDTPPSLGWLTQSAFYASQYTVVCVIPQAYSILALKRLSEFIEEIQMEHPVKVFGVCASCWSERGATNPLAFDLIEASFPNLFFSSKIRRDEVVSKAAYAGKTVLELEHNGRAANDYRDLTEEFLMRFNNIQNQSKTTMEHYAGV